MLLIQQCSHVVSGGVGAIALVTVAYCQDLSSDIWAELYFKADQSLESSSSVALSEAFESDTLVAFETAVNDKTLGKYGDIVVTVGITILITESYLNSFDTTGNCAIDQLYSPSWSAGDESMIDSLQVLTRAALPGVIVDWQRQRDVIDRDCGGVLPDEIGIHLPETLEKLLTGETDGSNEPKCVKYNPDATTSPVTGSDLDELIKKFRQTNFGVQRWVSLLRLF